MHSNDRQRKADIPRSKIAFGATTKTFQATEKRDNLNAKEEMLTTRAIGHFSKLNWCSWGGGGGAERRDSSRIIASTAGGEGDCKVMTNSRLL
jgi:hypothetical protein